MPDASDKPTEENVQLPWESFVDDDAPAEPAQSAADIEGDAEMYARALARVEADAELDETPGATGDAEVVADFDAGDDAVSHAAPVADTDNDAVSYESPVPAEPLVDDLGPAPHGGGWTVTMLCAGIALIACCLLIPQADSNRRLVYERERLKVDLESLKKQVVTNDEFLRRVADDPNLAERLAQRQMKIIRQGTRVLELKRGPGGNTAPTPDDMSPFHLVHVAPPPPMPPYQSTGGRLANICYDPHKRLYLMGAGLFLMAAGLVLGFGPRGV